MLAARMITEKALAHNRRPSSRTGLSTTRVIASRNHQRRYPFAVPSSKRIVLGLIWWGRNRRASLCASQRYSEEVPVHGRSSMAKRMSMRMDVRSRSAFSFSNIEIISRSSRMASRRSNALICCGAALKFRPFQPMASATGGFSCVKVEFPSARRSRGISP
jgi:hypothetical protein